MACYICYNPDIVTHLGLPLRGIHGLNSWESEILMVQPYRAKSLLLINMFSMFQQDVDCEITPQYVL